MQIILIKAANLNLIIAIYFINFLFEPVKCSFLCGFLQVQPPMADLQRDDSFSSWSSDSSELPHIYTQQDWHSVWDLSSITLCLVYSFILVSGDWKGMSKHYHSHFTWMAIHCLLWVTCLYIWHDPILWPLHIWIISILFRDIVQGMKPFTRVICLHIWHDPILWPLHIWILSALFRVIVQGMIHRNPPHDLGSQEFII